LNFAPMLLLLALFIYGAANWESRTVGNVAQPTALRLGAATVEELVGRISPSVPPSNWIRRGRMPPSSITPGGQTPSPGKRPPRPWRYGG
jgi:hypothetical protein